MRQRSFNLFRRAFLGVVFVLVWLTGVQASWLGSLDGTPTATLMADMNSDGMDDIVVATENGITIYYTYYNAQTQSLELQPSLISTIKTNVLASFDVDGNGQKDLIVQDKETQTLYFLLNQGDSFSVHAETGVPLAQSVAVGMVNEDPYVDVVLGTTSGVFILWGIDPGWYAFNGNSWFFKGALSNFGGAVTALELKDMNSDGLLDIVVATSDERICILFQEEETDVSSFTPQTYYMASSAHNLYVADVNYDGLFDVLALTSDGINVFYGHEGEEGEFSLSSPLFIATSSYPTAIGLTDYNQDLILDMAVSLETEKKIVYIVNQGQANYVFSNYESQLSNPPTYVWSDDFTFDGDQDVIYVSKEGKGIFLLKNIGSEVIENLPSSDETQLELPQMELSVEPSGKVEVNASDSIKLHLSIDPKDYAGTPANLEIVITNYNTATTMYITALGLSNGEAPFWENWQLTQVDENIFSISTFDLFSLMGTGHYTITAVLTFTDVTGTTHYLSDTDEFYLIAQSFDYDNPPELELYVEEDGDYLRAYANFYVPDDWQGLPADVYLWNECTYLAFTEDTVECCVYVQKYKSDNTWAMEVNCQDAIIGCPIGEVEPFTKWSINTVNNVALFEFPLSVYPDADCTVNVKLVIQNWDGMDYTIWKQAPFNP